MISNQCPLPVVFRGSVGVVALRVTVPEASSSMPQVLRDCPVTPLLRCDPRMGATTVSSMGGHIWRWAGNIPPGFEPEFEPRLAHYSKCYTYTWFLLGFAKHIHIQFGA